MTDRADLRDSAPDNYSIRGDDCCALSLNALRARTALLVGTLIVVLTGTGCGARNMDMKRSGFDRQGIARTDDPAYRELSQAMEPTLSIGTRVIVVATAPAVGDIVVLHPPIGAFRGVCGRKHRVLTHGGSACDTSDSREGTSIDMISRVVAGPGDEIYVHGGHVYRRVRGGRRFSRELDSYVRSCGHGAACDLPVPITIAPGHWFVMGDNRGLASDSRSWGPVPTRWIIGIAMSLECPKRRARPRVWVLRSSREGCASIARK